MAELKVEISLTDQDVFKRFLVTLEKVLRDERIYQHVRDDYTEEIQGIIRDTDGSSCCGGRHEAIKWNPYNKVIQCHACGHVYAKSP